MLRSRSWLLRFFLGSITVNAALGIWALLAGEFGETEGKILLTSVLISAATLSVLVNATPVRLRSLWPLPVVAAVSAAGAFVALIVFTWAEVDHEIAFKAVGTALVVGAAGTLAGLLALVPLGSPYRWVSRTNTALIAVLALSGIWGIWFEPDESWYVRAIGVESVLVAATTLAIPILWRFGSGERPGPDQRLVVGAVTTHDVVSVEPSATLRQVVAALADHGVGIVVVRDSNSVAGVVGERDVVLAVHDGVDLDAVRAADVMSTSLAVLQDEATTDEAVREMAQEGVRHLLVLGDQGGVVSIRDLMRSAAGDRRSTLF